MTQRYRLSREKGKLLRDLFGLTNNHECSEEKDIGEVYMKERDAIQTEDQLRAHVGRWKPLFELYEPKDPEFPKEGSPGQLSNYGRVMATNAAYRLILSGAYDATETLDCLKSARSLKDPHCKHIVHYSCCGTQIVLPYPLMEAMIIAYKFIVPPNIAFIQLHGGYEALYGNDDHQARSNPQ